MAQGEEDEEPESIIPDPPPTDIQEAETPEQAEEVPPPAEPEESLARGSASSVNSKKSMVHWKDATEGEMEAVADIALAGDGDEGERRMFASISADTEESLHQKLDVFLNTFNDSAQVKEALKELYHLAEDGGKGLAAWEVLAKLKKTSKNRTRASTLAMKKAQMNVLTQGLSEFMAEMQAIHKESNRVAVRQMVKYRNVNYSAFLTAMDEKFETVGSMAMKPLMSLMQLMTGRKSQIIEKELVKDLTGYLAPGTLTLVIGPPGCGKSSVHKTLAGRGNTLAGKKLSGEVLYNDKNIIGADRWSGETYVPKRVSAYIQQTDQHYPTLSVKDTANFAYACTNVPLDDYNEDRLRKAAELPESELQSFAQIVLELLGLTKVMDTKVGDAAVRGVSGGERHRVTTMEFLVGSYLIYFCDEISTGLDASATFDIVSTFKIYSEVFRLPMLFSLLQPAPDVFDLFDRVILIDGGKTIYQGPREDILPYFEALGYKKPDRVDTADFLQEITSDLGSQYLLPGKTALSVNAFVESYKKSKYCKHNTDIAMSQDTSVQWFKLKRPAGCMLASYGNAGEIAISDISDGGNLSQTRKRSDSVHVKKGDKLLGYKILSGPGKSRPVFDGSEDLVSVIEAFEAPEGEIQFLVQHDLSDLDREPSDFTKQQFMQPYVQPPWESTKTVMAREFQVLKTNFEFVKTRFGQAKFIAILNGTLYWQISDADDKMSLRTSIFFVSIMSLAVGHMAQIPKIVDERSVFYKQHGAGFFRAASYVLSVNLSQIPIVAGEMVIFCPFLYFGVGLSDSSGGVHFLAFVTIIFLISNTVSCIVRAICSIMPGKEPAQMLVILMIMLDVLLAGFIIYKPSIPEYWIWYYWCNPFQWALSSLEVNEFTSKKWEDDCNPYAFPSTCDPADPVSRGVAFLKAYEFFDEQWYLYVGIAVLLGFWMAAFALSVYGYGCLKYDEVQAVALAEENTLKTLGEGEKAKEHISTVKTERIEMNPLHTQLLASQQKAEKAKSKLALDFPKLTLSWHELNYDVEIPGDRGATETRRLLTEVSGYARPEEMIALMGSSGAGKTTLLDVIACRKTTGTITGKILVNGYEQEPQSFARHTGYVEQMDIHMTYATVAEALWFSARLRLEQSISDAKVQEFVGDVMNLVELTPIKGDLIGQKNAGGLSVEQAKRLTIAVELVANPSILFLDEPTSGLDSRAAQIVMTNIEKIVDTGIAVVCTIHQPSARLFSYFHKLLLLKRGGMIVYFGELGENCNKLVNYFQNLPGTPNCRPDMNPAAYMLECIGAGIGNMVSRDFHLDYLDSKMAEENSVELERLFTGAEKLGPRLTTSGYAVNSYTQASLLLARTRQTYWRNVNYSFSRYAAMALLGVLLGSLFWRIEYDNKTGLQSRLGMVSIIATFLGLVNSQNCVPQLLAERGPFIREQAANMYRRWLYSSMNATVEIPYVVGTTFVFCFICCSMAEVSSPFVSVLTFIEFWGTTICYAYLMLTIGFAFSFLASNVEIAIVLVALCFNMWNTTSGFTLPEPDMPAFWKFLFYANPLRVVLSCLASTSFYCETKENECVVSYDATDWQNGCYSVEMGDTLCDTYNCNNQAYDVLTMVANNTVMENNYTCVANSARCGVVKDQNGEVVGKSCYPRYSPTVSHDDDSCDCTTLSDQNHFFAWDILHETYDFQNNLVFNYRLTLLFCSGIMRIIAHIVISNVDHNKR
ncbi:hypothetical protein CYMTET_48888 [Cymbomonas tetramitiformis]|uniref:ABC transporter domain-containing protein n=1 Tax=Cymbomonas tetramitiformis TaxID=36881 RepID=A0AAE0BSY8_9CHLO|nr:hypothetical protein CYMTET_48888 [Cymbomonas tetramitiformis]